MKDGTRVLAAIAQRHILIPWSGAPNDLALDGAFVAQKGSFHRRFYPNGFGSEDHYLKTSLSVYGMIASNGVPATSWVDGGGNVTSGYQSSSSEYDANMLYGPPPYFPSSDEYEFISWEEVQ
ncbi:hypothetical protein IH781_04060 [Patescibacteria group bacterium]|nr:hypothetical protein [Patescibacteria group bacterium]